MSYYFNATVCTYAIGLKVQGKRGIEAFKLQTSAGNVHTSTSFDGTCALIHRAQARPGGAYHTVRISLYVQCLFKVNAAHSRPPRYMCHTIRKTYRLLHVDYDWTSRRCGCHLCLTYMYYVLQLHTACWAAHAHFPPSFRHTSIGIAHNNNNNNNYYYYYYITFYFSLV
jgi:hypothetical protein